MNFGKLHKKLEDVLSEILKPNIEMKMKCVGRFDPNFKNANIKVEDEGKKIRMEGNNWSHILTDTAIGMEETVI